MTAMKKYFYIFLMAVVAIAACSKEQENSSVNGPKKVHLTFTGSTDALKTTLDTEDWGIDWSTIDKITVFAAVETPTNNEFTTESVSADDRVATFSGSAEEAATYYALSPAQSTATVADALTDCKITANLPSAQAATVGSFDPQANVSVATASNYEFLFKNVGALVGFTIGLDDITDVKIEAAGGEVLSGTVVVDPVSGAISEKTGESSVQLTGSFVNGSTYYFVILPGTYSNGFSITIWKGAQFIRLNKSGVQEIERNDNLNLGTLTGSNWKTAFVEGEEVTIQGAGVASPDVAGQKLAYVSGEVGSKPYWNTATTGNDVAAYVADGGYNYEIFTKLEAGKTIYFVANGGEKFTLNEAGTAVGHLSKTTQAAYSAPADGIYRIRMHLPSGAAEVKQINEVKYDLYGKESKVFDTYEGNGVWSYDNIPMVIGSGGDSYQDRYRFLVKFTDESRQYYGRWRTNGGHPTDTTTVSYFWMQPSTDTDHWDPAYKFPSEWESGEYKYYCKMTLSFNNGNGHYLYEMSNMRNPIDTGENVAIYGTGVTNPDVAGTTMRHSTSFYNSSVANSGDRTDNSSTMADPAGYDYEIFVNLTAGTKFYFTTAGGRHFAINEAGNAIVGILNEGQIAYAGVSNDGVYRIRINSSNGEVALRRAESARYLQPDRGTNQELTYIGNGVWRGYPVFGWTHPKAWGNSERFKFKFQIFFNETSTWQYYGRYETESVYTSTHLQPLTDTNTLASWDNFLTVENDPDLGKAAYQVEYGFCDMYLKLNADGYTYQISNIRQ